MVGTKVGSFVVRGVAGVAEFVIPAGSHLVTGVVKVVELTSTGVKTGFRGLIDAIRDTHINVTVKPTTVPGTLNTTLDITHLDTPVKPGTAVSDAFGLETVKIKPDVPDAPVDTKPHSSVDVKPDVPEPVRPAEPVDGGGTKPQYDPDAPVSKTVNQADSPGGKGSYSNQDIIDAYNRAPVNEQGVPVDHRTGEPLYPDGENGRGWHMKWDPNAERWVAENPGLGPGESGYLPPRAPESIWNEYQDALKTDPAIDPPYGYDHNGNRLPYANYRPPVSDRTVREVWWEAVKRWVIDDGAAEVRVTDINDLEVDVRWENNSSYRDILDQLKTRIDEFADGKITEVDYEAAIKELEDQFLNDTSPLPTRDGIWDMGHIPEQKYSTLRDDYLNHRIDLEKFLQEATGTKSFQVEDPLRNRSHTDESGSATSVEEEW